MKKKITVAAIVLLLLILFLPIPNGICKDGGTKDYGALTYRIVVWNRLVDQAKEGSAEVQKYHKVSVFWFPDNFKSINELWEIETERNR